MIQKSFPLELFKRICHHVFLDQLPVFQCGLVIGAGRSVHRQSFTDPVAVEIDIIRKHIFNPGIADGIHILQERKKERHLIGKGIISLLQKIKEILFYRLIGMYGNVQFLPYLYYIFRTEQIYFLTAEWISDRGLYLSFLDPARDRSCTDVILSRQLLLAQVIPVFVLKICNVYFHDTLYPFPESVNLNELTGLIISSRNISKRNIHRILKNTVHRAGMR